MQFVSPQWRRLIFATVMYVWEGKRKEDDDDDCAERTDSCLSKSFKLKLDICYKD